MSVHEFLAAQRALNNDEPPECWLVIANPVWGRCEDHNRIALFDTQALAMAYVEASKLPESVTTPDGIHRTFRPDSLLYDYNPGGVMDGLYGQPVRIGLHVDVDGVAINPAPPSGPVPEMRELARPRYGHDYDVGSGGPYTDTNSTLPEV